MSQKSALLEQALAEAVAALELIAMPARPDGTYNRGREACEQLARSTLQRISDIRTPAPAVAPAMLGGTGSGRGLTVYTDGGCKGNPGPAGWGAVLVGADAIMEASGFIGHATNQVAELVAAIEGLAMTPTGARVELVSDSQYMLKGLKEWRRGWERNGFQNSAGKPVANQDYWKRLYALADAREVTVRWVRGHNGDPFNERCDLLAGLAIAGHLAGN